MEREEREGVEMQRTAQQSEDADLQGEGEKRQIAGESGRAWAGEERAAQEAQQAPHVEDAAADEPDADER